MRVLPPGKQFVRNCGETFIVVHTANPWMSATDIDKGTRWSEEVAAALDTMKAGVICLTPENLSAEWLLFEAGALSKTRDPKTRVWTYLLAELKPQHVKDPLRIFQATVAEREDTRKLIHSLNKNLDAAVAEDRVNTLFDKFWPDLEKELAAIAVPSGAAPPTRPPEEMLAEILELTRAAAQSRKSAEMLDPYLPAFAEFMPVFTQIMPVIAEAIKAAPKSAGSASLPPGNVVRRTFLVKHHDDAQVKRVEGVNAVDDGSGNVFVLDETGRVLARFANVEQWWPETLEGTDKNKPVPTPKEPWLPSSKARTRTPVTSWAAVCQETGLSKGTAQLAIHSLPNPPVATAPVSAYAVAAD